MCSRLLAATLAVLIGSTAEVGATLIVVYRSDSEVVIAADRIERYWVNSTGRRNTSMMRFKRKVSGGAVVMTTCARPGDVGVAGDLPGSKR